MSTFMTPIVRTLLGVACATMAVGMMGCGGATAQREGEFTGKDAQAPASQIAESDKAPLVPGAKRSLKDTPFERSWDLQLPRAVRNAWISPNTPELVFFQLKETYEIYAVDAFSGNTRWVTPPFEKPVRLLPASSRVVVRSPKADEQVSDDRMWAISDGTLYSFDAVFGQLISRYDLPFSPSTSPLPLGSEGNYRIFMGDWDGRMQVVTYHADKGFPYILWQLNLRNALSAAPVEQEGLVYATDHAGTVHCFKYDRDEVWSFKTGASIYGSPLTRGRLLYVGNDDNVIYALNRLSGERLGSLYLNGPVKRAPFAFRGEPSRIYAWIDKDEATAGLYAIKTQNDNIPFTDNAKHPLEVERIGVEWYIPKVDRLVGSSPEHLFVTHRKSPVIHAVNRTSGKIDWSWDISEEHKLYRNEKGKLDPREVAYIAPYQDASDLNRSIFTADESGHVIAYRVYGDKPGDPTGGDKVLAKKPAAEAAKPGDAPAADPAAEKPAKAPKAAPAAAPAEPAEKPAAPAKPAKPAKAAPAK